MNQHLQGRQRLRLRGVDDGGSGLFQRPPNSRAPSPVNAFLACFRLVIRQAVTITKNSVLQPSDQVLDFSGSGLGAGVS